MKRNILILVSFFFLLQYSFAEALLSNKEEDTNCKDNAQECPVEKKNGKPSFDQASFWTVCIAASTVALPLTRSIIGSNFMDQSSFRYQVVYKYEQHPPSYSTITNTSSQDIIPTHHLFTIAHSFNIEMPYKNMASLILVDDIQVDYRASLNFDFFKHRFSRFMA